MNLMKKIAALLGASLHTPQGYRKSRPWHDATNPHQKARIEAAAAKRARKAEKLTHDATLSAFNNMAHGFTGQRHNSFYIAK